MEHSHSDKTLKHIVCEANILEGQLEDNCTYNYVVKAFFK